MIKIKKSVTDVDATDDNASYYAMNTSPHAPNFVTAPDAENRTSVRQILDGQEYHVAKGEIIKMGFDREYDVEVAYLHDLSQITGCPGFTVDIISLFTWLQILPINNISMLGAAQFMVDFQGVHFNAKNALYIIFHKHASIFCKAMLSTMNDGGRVRFCVFPTSIFANINSYLSMDNRYSGLIFQHALANIINVS